MWFDVNAALATLGSGHIPAPEPGAGYAPAQANSQNSRDSQPPAAQNEEVTDHDVSPYGTSVGGRPLTCTGRVVSLNEWRRLSEWERHGPNGKVWCGIAQRWRDSL